MGYSFFESLLSIIISQGKTIKCGFQHKHIKTAALLLLINDRMIKYLYEFHHTHIALIKLLLVRKMGWLMQLLLKPF